MKKLLYSLFLFSLLAACAVPVSTPEPIMAMENTIQPAETVPFTPIPTFTATVELQPTTDFPTFTPPAVQPGQPNAIQFAANGTYADITDTIAMGSSKTYSINAMKGQMMSVSVLPQIPDGSWGYIPMQIKGADGLVLCPQSVNSECMFWRGILPASQDYFVTLTANGDVPQFVMRVAINPPGKEMQYFQYNNSAAGLSLTYPDTFVPALPLNGNYKTNPELALQFIDSKLYDETNLSEAYLFISSSTDAQVVAACTEPNQNGGAEYPAGDEVINGYTFVHTTSEGAGAGNYYQQEIYRMVNNTRCYEVIYYLHSSNIGNYPPDSNVTEFDKGAIIQKLYSVFSTFAIK